MLRSQSSTSQSVLTALLSPLHCLLCFVIAPESTISSFGFRFDIQINSIHILTSWPADTSTPPSSSKSIIPCFLWCFRASRFAAGDWKTLLLPSRLDLFAGHGSLTAGWFEAAGSRSRFVSLRFGSWSSRCHFFVQFSLCGAGWTTSSSSVALAGVERDLRRTSSWPHSEPPCIVRCSSCPVWQEHHYDPTPSGHHLRQSYS